MPKRRRLFTPLKNRQKVVTNNKDIKNEAQESFSNGGFDSEVSVARGRLKGALKEALEPLPPSDESASSRESSPIKRDRKSSEDRKEHYTDEEVVKKILRRSPPRQSYVLKLFDRSVDLSQFQDDSPLYPICRAWMANQPKANYNDFESYKEDIPLHSGVELPGPEGDPVPKVPELLPEQLAADKNNINLNYREAPPPGRELLLRVHMERWAAIKQAWQEQMMRKEARYEGTQQVLNRINLEYPPR